MYRIRLAEARDIPVVLDLLHQVGQVHHDIRPDLFRDGALKYDTSALERLLLDESRPIFVAEDGEKVRGYAFCICKITRDDPALQDQKELYIDDLCVDRQFRGQGVAQELYQHVLAYARAQAYDSVTLNVWEGNDRARAFYEKQGLTPRKTMMEYRL